MINKNGFGRTERARIAFQCIHSKCRVLYRSSYVSYIHMALLLYLMSTLNTRTKKKKIIHSIPVHKIANFWYFSVLYVSYKHMALLFNNNDHNNNTNIIILTIICEKIYKYKVYKYKVENTLKI